jgi:hypothetical protein
MSEDDLLRTVLDMARLFGVLAAHFRPALSQSGRWHTAVQGDGKGYPDLTLVGTRQLIRELKSERGVLTPEQRRWMAAMTEAGLDVAVWRPQDLRSGAIERELRAIRKPSANVVRKPQEVR